ncbi:MAG: 6-phosphogluconolactonase [Gemmatimonadetes bacterium]|nr:6-phosphogluconolactonase [Gemmatimonadota bacterium]
MAISHEVVVAPIAALQQRLRRLVQEASRRAVAEGRRFSLAIPGGSVVTQLLVALRADDIDWSSTDIFWCDERAVAPGHPDSNYGASIAGWLGALRATVSGCTAWKATIPRSTRRRDDTRWRWWRR